MDKYFSKFASLIIPRIRIMSQAIKKIWSLFKKLSTKSLQLNVKSLNKNKKTQKKEESDRHVYGLFSHKLLMTCNFRLRTRTNIKQMPYSATTKNQEKSQNEAIPRQRLNNIDWLQVTQLFLNFIQHLLSEDRIERWSISCSEK